MNEGKKKASNVISFPEYQKLQDEVEMLRTEMSMLLLERDELQFVICRNIETEYMLKIGGLEYKVYEAECTVLRLKRKIEMIQAKKNRQEKVNLTMLEEILDAEFAEYQQALNGQMEKMNDALQHSKGEFLSEEETKELKKTYRSIVKVLHPDLHADLTPAQKTLFNHAVTAYKNGDLESLRIIYEMVGEPVLSEKHQDALDQLHKEIERLKTMLNTIRENIEKIKSEYPYKMKELLEDVEKLEQHKADLETFLSQYQELIAVYQARIEEMLR